MKIRHPMVLCHPVLTEDAGLHYERHCNTLQRTSAAHWLPYTAKRFTECFHHMIIYSYDSGWLSQRHGTPLHLTATHCKSLQHRLLIRDRSLGDTFTICNTLQPTATQWVSATHCNTGPGIAFEEIPEIYCV